MAREPRVLLGNYAFIETSRTKRTLRKASLLGSICLIRTCLAHYPSTAWLMESISRATRRLELLASPLPSFALTASAKWIEELSSSLGGLDDSQSATCKGMETKKKCISTSTNVERHKDQSETCQRAPRFLIPSPCSRISRETIRQILSDAALISQTRLAS